MTSIPYLFRIAESKHGIIEQSKNGILVVIVYIRIIQDIRIIVEW